MEYSHCCFLCVEPTRGATCSLSVSRFLYIFFAAPCFVCTSICCIHCIFTVFQRCVLHSFRDIALFRAAVCSEAGGSLCVLAKEIASSKGPGEPTRSPADLPQSLLRFTQLGRSQVLVILIIGEPTRSPACFSLMTLNWRF